MSKLTVMERKDPGHERLRRQRDKLLDECETAIKGGDLETASRIFRKIANITMELGEFDLALEFVDKADRLERNTMTNGSIYLKEKMRELQEAAREFYSSGKYKEARNILVQLIAIAEQLGNERLLKAYKENLKKVKQKLGKK